MSVIADRLRRLRAEKQKTQDQVAKDLSMNIRRLQAYEIAEAIPRTRQVLLLADYYNVSVDYIVGRTNDPTPPVPRDTPDAPGAPDEPG